MSEPGNALDLVAAAFRALAACDLEAAAPFFAEDVTYHLLNQDAAHRRIFEGRKAFLDLRDQVARVSGGTYTFDVHGMDAAGDEMVIVHAETRVTFDGRTGGGHWVIVARVINGVIVQMTDTPETALDRFWRPRQ
jgi:ketosteroid isomerase-like protein